MTLARERDTNKEGNVRASPPKEMARFNMTYELPGTDGASTLRGAPSVGRTFEGLTAGSMLIEKMAIVDRASQSPVTVPALLMEGKASIA